MNFSLTIRFAKGTVANRYSRQDVRAAVEAVMAPYDILNDTYCTAADDDDPTDKYNPNGKWTSWSVGVYTGDANLPDVFLAKEIDRALVDKIARAEAAEFYAWYEKLLASSTTPDPGMARSPRTIFLQRGGSYASAVRHLQLEEWNGHDVSYASIERDVFVRDYAACFNPLVTDARLDADRREWNEVEALGVVSHVKAFRDWFDASDGDDVFVRVTTRD